MTNNLAIRNNQPLKKIYIYIYIFSMKKPNFHGRKCDLCQGMGAWA